MAMSWNKTKPAKRGASLATVLTLTFVITLLIFALASSSVTHLKLSERATSASSAKNLAESSLALGLERVLQDHSFGSTLEDTEPIVVEGSVSGSFGRLTFDPKVAGNWRKQASTNNLAGESSVAGASGRVVPGHSLHLVGHGEHNGVSRSVEALFFVPSFPFVVATEGSVRTEGNLLIAGVENGAGPPETDFSNLEDLRPGDIASNSAAIDSLNLGELTTITGDVRSVGGIVVENGAKIEGMISPNREAVEIPRYDISQYDPEFTGKSGVQYLDQRTMSRARFEGWVKRDGDLFLRDGTHLDSGVLYVGGDLVISDGITGLGAVFVEGRTTISGRSSLSSDNVVALVSDGNILLSGIAGDPSDFRGIVYTNGGLKTENVTLVGTVIVANQDSELVLKDSQIIQSAESSFLDLDHGARTAIHFVSPKGANPGAFLGTRNSGNNNDSKLRFFVSPDEDGGLLVYKDGTSERDAIKVEDESRAIEVLRNWLLAVNPSNENLPAFDAASSSRLRTLLQNLRNGSLEPEESEVRMLSIDPSRFLGLTEKIELILMKDV